MAAAQSSRGTLIATAVVSLVLALTFFILAIVFYVNKSQAEQRLTLLTQSYENVVSQPQLTTAPTTTLQELRSRDSENFQSNQNLMTVAVRQIERLSTQLAGVPDSVAALSSATTALQAANQQNINGQNMVAAIQSAVDAVAAAKRQVSSLEGQLAAREEELKQTIARTTQQMAQKDEQVAAADQRAQLAITAAGNDRSQQGQLISAMQQEMEERAAATAAQDEQRRSEIAALNAQLAQARAELDNTRTRLSSIRQPTNLSLTAADGQIVRANPSNDRVFINLGSGDAISPGMTFEVFSSLEGTPGPSALASNDNNVVRGKAAIEIIRVQPGSSEARVIRKDANAQINPGDLLVNLVYDRNTTYTFTVFGEFDLDRNNIASAADTEVIKRLISEWGGKIRDDVSVATDFVVLGKEPVVPEYTAEEMQDPLVIWNLQQAQARLEQYVSIREQAERLSIPVLNQNRFLYLVGYYDLAPR